MTSPLGGGGRGAQFLSYRLKKMAKLICSPLHEDGLSQRVLVVFQHCSSRKTWTTDKRPPRKDEDDPEVQKNEVREKDRWKAREEHLVKIFKQLEKKQ